MPSSPFISYAQNGEDVVLWRALSGVHNGRYVDVGANDPTTDSVTRAFYDRGWSGLDVEPVASFAGRLRAQRPRDIVAEVAVSPDDGGDVLLHEFVDSGLSTVREDYVAAQVDRGFGLRQVTVPGRRLDSLVAEHLAGAEVHFCKIDVEGAEADVLHSVDLTTWRPWVLVIEATRPNSTRTTQDEWEDVVLAAGYRFCLFDGLSRYYVSNEHDDLAPALSYPACPLDDAVRVGEQQARDDLHELQQVHHALNVEVDRLRRDLSRCGELEREVESLRRELVRWRGAVLERWAGTAPPPDSGGGVARQELEAMRRTVSWRVTRPLRAVRARQRRLRS